MADTKISALPQATPALTDLVPYADMTGPTTRASLVSSLNVALGGMVLLEEHTVSGAATLDFTTRNLAGFSGNSFQSDFDDYVVRLIDITPSATLQVLNGQVTTNGGSTWDSSANYSYTHWQYRAGASAASGQAAQTATQIAGGLSASNTAGWGIVGHLNIFNPLSTSFFKMMVGQGFMLETTVPSRIGYLTNCTWEQTTAVTGLRLIFAAGTISGTARLYGMRK